MLVAWIDDVRGYQLPTTHYPLPTTNSPLPSACCPEHAARSMPETDNSRATCLRSWFQVHRA
ncbi:hypothetical protein K431DRAFT_283311 [Polychaeton citri CBS 116435]|uniref:Uncharacterized protein n=1 Tax=Polychaeton citri CBS 116435 TaxID=1314669 RepID=A0A9P4UQR9_9PEZI|nr:hypothetical protein K431DRAFT_283311 [Polychaeton citri CBS 116435]